MSVHSDRPNISKCSRNAIHVRVKRSNGASRPEYNLIFAITCDVPNSLNLLI
ncbi:protein of unknown function [Cyanobium sp. NIES-981]|nr:protein of unknown function [Cyanobium sp. NIES-981]